jgi:DNA mismatch repair protein MLH3
MTCNRSNFVRPADRSLQSNPAYAATENRIHSVKAPPAAYHITGGHDILQHDERGYNYPESDILSERFKLGQPDTRYETSMNRFMKDDLRRAEVISQVDRKFIVCRVTRRGASDPSMAPSTHLKGSEAEYSDSTLVLIDQHAADERVRVEHFLKELCLGFLYSQDQTEGKQASGIRTTELNPPRPVLLTQHEARSINGSQDVQEMLRKWGVGFAELSKVMPDAASESGSSNGYSQLLVSSIPRVVCDKVCRLGCFPLLYLSILHCCVDFSYSWN